MARKACLKLVSGRNAVESIVLILKQFCILSGIFFCHFAKPLKIQDCCEYIDSLIFMVAAINRGLLYPGTGPISASAIIVCGFSKLHKSRQTKTDN